MKVKLEMIHDSSNKLREVTRDDSFQELMNSLQTQGLLQPVKVRPNNNGYELIYGHRRTAAMRQLGWDECEVIIEDVDDQNALAQSLIENLHREDMTTLEEAMMYKRIQETGFTTNDIASSIGKSRAYVQSRVKLLDLPEPVQRMISPGQRYGKITSAEGNIPIDAARNILSTAQNDSESIQMAEKIVEERLTLSQIRALSKQIKNSGDSEQRQQILEKPFVEKSDAPDETISVQPNISKKHHTANRSVGEQFHAKCVWNLQRISLENYHHFTIGYSQRNWAQFYELLQLANVSILVDSRHTPVSQYKPEFSKSNLQIACDKAEIEYLHLRELGISPGDRVELADDHNYDSLFNQYDCRVTIENIQELLADKLETERMAFMCVELDPATCHRHRIAMMLESHSYRTLDL